MSVSSKLGHRPTSISGSVAIVFGILGLCLQPGSAASMLGPPDPPLGWQQEITEGFDPPIERVLVLEWRVRGTELSQYAEQWGKTAFDVLMKLWNDARWRGYHEPILRFMGAVDAERTRAHLEKHFAAYAQRDKLNRPQTTLFYSIINQLYVTSPESLQTMTRKYVLDATPELQDVLINNVLGRSPSKETMDFLRQLRDAAESRDRQKRIESTMKRVAGILRAREPMDAVLKAEGSDKP